MDWLDAESTTGCIWSNNTRFLLLRPVPNLGSRVLGLCARHRCGTGRHGFIIRLLLETFVDPSRFVGTVYRAAGWTELGMTRSAASGAGTVHAEEGPYVP